VSNVLLLSESLRQEQIMWTPCQATQVFAVKSPR